MTVNVVSYECGRLPIRFITWTTEDTDEARMKGNADRYSLGIRTAVAVPLSASPTGLTLPRERALLLTGVVIDHSGHLIARNC